MNIENKQIFCAHFTMHCCALECFFMQNPGFIGVANFFKEQNKPKQEKISEYAQIHLANKLYSQQPNGP